MATTPFRDSALARFVSKRILELRPKSQTEIAAEAGFPNANFLSMVKTGVSKLAIDRVPALAQALECDPAYLMRLALEQEVGSTAAKALVEILGTPVSANERLWLDERAGQPLFRNPMCRLRSVRTLAGRRPCF
ncbi:MAG: XRE family transcriptional regulator [Alphaproteobacteria bacterium]